MIRYLLLLTFFCHVSVFASSEEERIGRAFTVNVLNLLQQTQAKLDIATGPDFQSSKDDSGEFPNRGCQNFYAPLLEKSVIRMDYFVGYLNFEYGVVDRFEREALKLLLQQPCVPGSPRMSCGFKQAMGDVDLLQKDIIWPDGIQRRFEFRIVSPSASWSDLNNRANHLQNILSQNTRIKFLQALEKSDFLIYSGHSRYGGGPDFFPEILNKTGRPDVEFYRATKPGMLDIRNQLDKRTSPGPAMLAILSCDSKKHFNTAIEESKAKPALTVLTAEKFLDFETFPIVAALIDSFTKGSCLNPVLPKIILNRN